MMYVNRASLRCEFEFRLLSKQFGSRQNRTRAGHRKRFQEFPSIMHNSVLSIMGRNSVLAEESKSSMQLNVVLAADSADYTD